MQLQALLYKQQAEANKKHLQAIEAQKEKDKSDGEEEDGASEGGEDEIYYDEMEYGDEANDAEERDYKRQRIQEAATAAAQKYELPKRATRGLRMNALMGKALEEDEQFYKGLFGEGKDQADSSSDRSFCSEDSGEARDSFDSDFDKMSSG